MSYPAHVTDTVYRYDGTFQGFLCCIFESYSRKEIPAAVCAPDRGQISFYDSCEIVTDPARAQRVARGLERLGPTVKERITTGFLSDDPEHELILLRFARICFEKGPAAARATGDPDICAAFDLERAVNNEACKYIEFIRFEQRDMMLGTVIHPKNRILPLLRGHFCSRLPDEDFMIFDATHGIAMLRRDRKVQYMVMEHYDKNTGQEELDWQKLWKRFFDAVTIEQRRNERCQMTHAPKRYWKDMCEMALLGRGTAGKAEQNAEAARKKQQLYPLCRHKNLWYTNIYILFVCVCKITGRKQAGNLPCGRR